MAVTTQWLQNVAYAARIDRALFAQLWDEGVCDLASFAVTERGAGANMTVDASAGRAVVEGDDQANQGNYLVTSTAAVTETAIGAAPGSGTRHDLIVLQVQDPNAGGAAGDNAIVKVIAGTPSATPADPAVPDSALVLARVRVPSGTVSITDALVDDLRPLAGRRDVPGARMETHSSRAISGWLPEDGRTLNTADYPGLAAALGAVGATFTLPDTRGRKTVVTNNLGTAAGAATGNSRIVGALGSSGGTATHTLTTAQMPVHTHTQNAHNHGTHTHGLSNLIRVTVNAVLSRNASLSGSGTTLVEADGGGSFQTAQPAAQGNANATPTNNNTGGGNSHPNTDPYLAVYGWVRT